MTHTTHKSRLTVLAVAGALMLLAGGALAQEVKGDAPTALNQMPKPADQVSSRTTETDKITFEAVCWYLPNRIMDLADIVRVYFTVGDGLGVSVRATQYLNGSYLQNDAFAIGWTPRKPPVFGEKIEESYFGFMAAHEGEIRRDPTEVGFSIYAIAGFNCAISLGEVADFFAGLVGIDLMNDDHGPFVHNYTEEANPVTERLRQELYTPHEYTTDPYKSPSGEIGPPTQPARPGAPAGTTPPPATVPSTIPVPVFIR